jgi:hypothetical protein
MLLRDIGSYVVYLVLYIGWWLFTVEGFWALWDSTYDVYVVITVAMLVLLRDIGSYVVCLGVYIVGWLFAVKGFWALWDSVICVW